MQELCRPTCYVSIVFLLASIYMFASVGRSCTSLKFMSMLPKSLQEEYDQRISERKYLQLKGYGLGLLLSGVYLIFSIYVLKNNQSRTRILCTTGFITYLTGYFVYMLSKKQPLMVTLLENDEQKQEWEKLYKKMQFHYNLGTLLGVVAVVVFANSMCSSGGLNTTTVESDE